MPIIFYIFEHLLNIVKKIWNSDFFFWFWKCEHLIYFFGKREWNFEFQEQFGKSYKKTNSKYCWINEKEVENEIEKKVK